MALSMIFSKRPEICAIFACTASLHELGHIVASRMLGIKLKSITLGASGAILTPAGGLGSYKQELLLSASGPAANLAVAAVSYLSLVRLLKENWTLEKIFLVASECLSDNSAINTEGVLSIFFTFSVLQAGINLMPVSTFDGGRIFFCTVAVFSSIRTAEIAMSIASSLAAFAVWSVSVYILLKANAGLGIFAFSLCMFARIVGMGRETIKKSETA